MMGNTGQLILLVGGTAAVLVVVLIIIFNRLVALRQNAQNAWAQIDVQLQRRYDLIPNLVETVKAFMAHEQETLMRVTEARNRALQASGVKEKAAADSAVSSALMNLFAVSEAYPELRSSENMLSLQEELKSTENKVSFARQYHNDAVTLYNTAIEQFPSSLIAGAFRFRARELFEVDDEAFREPVRVKF